MKLEEQNKKDLNVALQILQVVKDDAKSTKPKATTLLAEDIKKIIDKEALKYDY